MAVLYVCNAPAMANESVQRISVGFDLPKCQVAKIDPPPITPPPGFDLVRTDLIDWNQDGICDVAYFYAPKDPKARKALGGYAVNFFVSTGAGALWQQVKRLGLFVEKPQPDAAIDVDFYKNGSHFLIEDSSWAISPQLGVLLVLQGMFPEPLIWSAINTEFESAGIDGLGTIWKAELENHQVVEAVSQDSLQEIKPDPDSQDLRFLRVTRILCLLKKDFPCVVHAAERAAMHPASDWDDVGALHAAVTLAVKEGDQSLADSAVFLNTYKYRWKIDYSIWSDWYRSGWAQGPLHDAARHSITQALGDVTGNPDLRSGLTRAIGGYFFRKNFQASQKGRLPDGRAWQAGLSDGGLMLRIGQDWKVLMALPWVGYALGEFSPEKGWTEVCDDFCLDARAKIFPALWPSSSLVLNGQGNAREFSTHSSSFGLSGMGASAEGGCNFLPNPAYFQIFCNYGYDGGTHPDAASETSFFSKNPAVFGQPVEDEVTCLDARYSQTALTRAWHNLLASCAMEMDEGKSEITSKNFQKWLEKGKEIVGQGLPKCNYVEVSTDGKLKVVASTGMIARVMRYSSCDQATVSVPLLNREIYLKTHLQRQLPEFMRLMVMETKKGGDVQSALAYIALDASLNKAYQTLLKVAPAEKHSLIRNMQREWIIERDKLVTGKPVLVANVCFMECNSKPIPYQGTVASFIQERITAMEELTKRYAAQQDLKHKYFERRLPKCVTPLTFNECDVPIVVKWCWDLEGKLTDWHRHENSCAETGPVISRIEPEKELAAQTPLSNLPLQATLKIYGSCVATTALGDCRLP